MSIPNPMMLDEAIDEIMEHIRQTIEDYTKPDENGDIYLEGVEAVVRGDRDRPRPKTPCIWVFPNPAECTHQPRTLAETWNFPITIAAIVKDNDPLAGKKMSNKLAARARSVVIKDRGLGKRKYVQDTRSSRFEPSGPWHSEGSMFAAVAVIEVVIVLLEDRKQWNS